MVDWLYYVLLLLLLVTGVLLNLVTLPGNWLMLASMVGYWFLTKYAYFYGWWLVVLLVIALAAEVIEFISAGRAARNAGATILGTIGALLGAVVGGITLTGVVPIPVLGTIVGIILGTFLGSMSGELVMGKEVSTSMEVGIASAKGRIYATILKSGVGVVILLLSLLVALPVRFFR